MARLTEFQTSDLDLAAAIMSVTGKQPEIFRQPGREFISFEFPDDEVIRRIIIDYAGGELVKPVRRFAACRSWLYRKVKDCVRVRT